MSLTTLSEKEVLEAEATLQKAMESSEVEVLRELLSERLLFTTHWGQRVSKREDLALHASGDLKIHSLQLSDHKVEISANTAVVSVRAEISATFQGQSSSGDFMFTRVWSKAEGTLQLLAGHSCEIPTATRSS